MSVDVFKMHGRGIVRLEEVLGRLITIEDEDIREFYYDDDTLTFLQQAYDKADAEEKKYVKLEVGMIDGDECEYNAPGYVLYIPQVVIDVTGIPIEQADEKIENMLRFIIENSHSPDDDIYEMILNIFRKNSGSIDYKEIISHVEAEGVFY